jgi:hypothetical protein
VIAARRLGRVERPSIGRGSVCPIPRHIAASASVKAVLQWSSQNRSKPFTLRITALAWVDEVPAAAFSASAARVWLSRIVSRLDFVPTPAMPVTLQWPPMAPSR